MTASATDREPHIDARDIAVMDHEYQPASISSYFDDIPANWNAGPLRARKAVARPQPDGAAERKRIASLQAIGADWDGRSANDNDYWPLLKALSDPRETMADKGRLIAAAVAYRAIEAKANNANPLHGTGYDGSYRLDQRTWVNEDGELVYKGVRVVSTDEPIPPRRAQIVTIDDDGVQAAAYTKVPTKWNGDASLIAMLDAKPMLARLERELGPLLQPLNHAVVFARSLTDIGFDEGAANNSTAAGMGKGLVYRGLRVVAGVLE